MTKPCNDWNHVVGNGIRSLNEFTLEVRGTKFLYMIILLHWLFVGLGRQWFANDDLSSNAKWVTLQVSKSYYMNGISAFLHINTEFPTAQNGR